MKLGIDVNRHKEIIVKAISGLLLLMLKHFKLNHIYQVYINNFYCVTFAHTESHVIIYRSTAATFKIAYMYLKLNVEIDCVNLDVVIV